MSSFICEHCGAEIKESESGHYVTECEHYPFEHKQEVMAGQLIIRLYNFIHQQNMRK